MFTSIFLPLPGTSLDASAIDATIQMAAWMQARVAILHAAFLPAPPAPTWGVAPELMVFTLDPAIGQSAREKAQALRDRLARESVSIRVEEIEVYEYDFPRQAATRARVSGLVVMPSQPDLSDRAYSLRMFQDLLAYSGRPVLALPPGARLPAPPERAVVAWKSSPQCARALHDALPILRACHHVEVLHLVDPSVAPTLDPVGVEHFRELGVAATWHERALPAHQALAPTILDHAKEMNAQLVVAGAYGHSRLHEWILGSATQDLFLRSPLPVLFSH